MLGSWGSQDRQHDREPFAKGLMIALLLSVSVEPKVKLSLLLSSEV